MFKRIFVLNLFCLSVLLQCKFWHWLDRFLIVYTVDCFEVPVTVSYCCLQVPLSGAPGLSQDMANMSINTGKWYNSIQFNSVYLPIKGPLGETGNLYIDE